MAFAHGKVVGCWDLPVLTASLMASAPNDLRQRRDLSYASAALCGEPQPLRNSPSSNSLSSLSSGLPMSLRTRLRSEISLFLGIPRIPQMLSSSSSSNRGVLLRLGSQSPPCAPPSWWCPCVTAQLLGSWPRPSGPREPSSCPACPSIPPSWMRRMPQKSCSLWEGGLDPSFLSSESLIYSTTPIDSKSYHRQFILLLGAVFPRVFPLPR